MATTICFVIVNLTITYILYSSYKKEAPINTSFLIALYFTSLGNTLAGECLYNVNYYLSALNIVLALFINMAMYKKLVSKGKKEDEDYENHLKMIFGIIKNDIWNN